MKISRKWRREWQKMTKQSKRQICTLMLAGTFFVSGIGLVEAMPENGQIVGGNGAIIVNGKVMDVNQASNNMIVDWGNFNIWQGETVRFNQPGAASNVLNRVIGGSPSQIFGAMQANGNVFLVNPAGVMFAPGSSVNVAGLVASTLNISNSDFMAGKNSFFQDNSFSGTANASVVNQGRINTQNYAVMLAPEVVNSGTINVQSGDLVLGGGRTAVLDLGNAGSVNIEIAGGKSVINNGNLVAQDGTVLLTVKNADALIDSVVNNTGEIKAGKVTVKDNKIILEGADTLSNSGILTANEGTVKIAARENGVKASKADVQGSIDVSGSNGGKVEISADNVTLTDANINASGAGNGGMVYVGGEWQGSGSLYQAKNTAVDKDTVINASAGSVGNGGKIVVWAKDRVDYFGKIYAEGGKVKGDGGRVEVSGKKNLLYKGSVFLKKNNGNSGLLLLDPDSLTIKIGASGVNEMTPDEVIAALAAAGQGTTVEYSGTSFVSVENSIDAIAAGALGKLQLISDAGYVNIGSSSNRNVNVRVYQFASTAQTVFANYGTITSTAPAGGSSAIYLAGNTGNDPSASSNIGVYNFGTLNAGTGGITILAGKGNGSVIAGVQNSGTITTTGQLTVGKTNGEIDNGMGRFVSSDGSGAVGTITAKHIDLGFRHFFQYGNINVTGTGTDSYGNLYGIYVNGVSLGADDAVDINAVNGSGGIITSQFGLFTASNLGSNADGHGGIHLDGSFDNVAFYTHNSMVRFTNNKSFTIYGGYSDYGMAGVEIDGFGVACLQTTSGNITLGSGARIIATGQVPYSSMGNTSVGIDAGTGNFYNNSGLRAGAINVGSNNRWAIFSNAASTNTAGGLSGTVIYGKSYVDYPYCEGLPGTGNLWIYRTSNPGPGPTPTPTPGPIPTPTPGPTPEEQAIRERNNVVSSVTQSILQTNNQNAIYNADAPKGLADMPSNNDRSTSSFNNAGTGNVGETVDNSLQDIGVINEGAAQPEDKEKA